MSSTEKRLDQQLSQSAATVEIRGPVGKPGPQDSGDHKAPDRDDGGDGDGDGDGDNGAADGRAFARGTCVGRYVIFEHLHSGGMGAVYRAFDPDLNRPVALKLVSARVEGASGNSFRDRMLREAQGLAQLSHPNVVAIYDVGIIEGDVFIAMELVEGKTLRRWLESNRRRKDVLDVFAAAAEGLAAAHQAELVHRDVKPDNILIGDDGRVRVVDFGLVRPADSSNAAALESSPGASGAGETRSAPTFDSEPPLLSKTITSESSATGPTTPLFSQLTEAGSLIGTPTYMAPEQFANEDIGPATDQFGLCVSLYEALCGRRPFAGESVDALRRTVCAGHYRPPPADARVPARLRRLLARGLARDPARRFPSMSALAAELRRDPAARWRRGLALSAAALGIAATAAIVARAPAADVCTNAERGHPPLWSAATRADARANFAATEAGYAGSTFKRVDGMLSAFDREFTAQRRDACEATHVRGEQSPRLLDLRMRCLDEARERVGALVELFSTSIDKQLVDRAAVATSELTSLTRCASAKVLTASVPPPASDTARAEAERIAIQLARVEALEAAGRYAEGQKLAERAVSRARAIDYAPSEARAMLRLGSVADKAGDYEHALETFEAALPIAAQARQPRVVADLWIAMTFVNGVRLRRYEQALALEQPAGVAVALAGDDPRLRAKLADRLGSVHLYAGNLERARQSLLASLADRGRAEGTTELELAEGAANLGAVLMSLREFAEAETYIEQAVTVHERELGAGHPRLASLYYNLGHSYSERGDQDRAADAVSRALAIEETSLGPRHPDLAPTLGLLGRVELRRGHNADAAELIGRALGIIESRLGPDDRYAVTAREELGLALFRTGHFAEAESHLQRALVTTEKKSDVGPQRSAGLILRLGDVFAARGDCRAATRHYRRAAQLTGDPKQPWALVGIAECALRQNKPADEQALADSLTNFGDSFYEAELRGRTEVALAALAQRRGQTARASELANRAALDLDRAGDRRAAARARALVADNKHARTPGPAAPGARPSANGRAPR